jgi:anti-anti-sigma factor
MSGSELAIGHGGRDEIDILVLQGELDLTNTEFLVAELALARRRTVVLDLSLLVFVDSAGIRAIDAAHGQLRGDGRSLLVVAPPDSRAGWTFRVAGFDGDAVFDSLDAATHRAGAADADP